MNYRYDHGKHVSIYWMNFCEVGFSTNLDSSDMHTRKKKRTFLLKEKDGTDIKLKIMNSLGGNGKAYAHKHKRNGG